MAQTDEHLSFITVLLAELRAFPALVNDTQSAEQCEELIADAQQILLPTTQVASDFDGVPPTPANAGTCWMELSDTARREYRQIVGFLELQMTSLVASDAARNPDYVGMTGVSTTQARRVLKMVRLRTQYLGHQSHQSRAGMVQRSE
jgi:hypothetical protein